MVKTVESEKEFKDILEKAQHEGKLVVVDFFATWCGPCKVLAPKLDDLSKTHTDVIFLKVDVDQLEGLAQQFGITAMPTIMLLKNGQPVGQVVGANLELIKAQVAEHSKTPVAA